jgi:hypothetical protein
MKEEKIAAYLREQIKDSWPHVGTVLALRANNKNGQFSESIDDIMDRLLPREVHYGFMKASNMPVLLELFNLDFGVSKGNIHSLPIRKVLFESGSPTVAKRVRTNECDECGKMFSEEPHLIGNSEEPPSICDECYNAGDED